MPDCRWIPCRMRSPQPDGRNGRMFGLCRTRDRLIQLGEADIESHFSTMFIRILLEYDSVTRQGAAVRCPRQIEVKLCV